MAVELEKLPPHDLEAERATLGSLLLENGALPRVSPFLHLDDFYSIVHRAIYGAMLELEQRNAPIDVVTLGDELRRRNLIDDVGGDAYIASLFSAVPTWMNAEHYAHIVARLAVYRRMIELAGRMGKVGYDAPSDLDIALAEWDQLAQAARDGLPTTGPRLITDVMAELFADADGEHSAGIATRMAGIDGMLGGLRGGDLIALAARTGQGKSAMATCIASNAALHQGCNVLLFSLEMGEMQVAERLLAQAARVDAQDLRLRRLSVDQWQTVSHAAGEFSNARGNIWVDETGGLNIATVRARAQQIQMKHGLDLVIVDYLQLVTSGGENRTQELAAVARGLKNMAKALHVPVLACAQFNRQGENMPDETPRMGWIEGSGEIEKASDIVMMLHIPDRAHRERYECIIAKHRGGPVGVVNLNWDARTVTFWTEQPEEVF